MSLFSHSDNAGRFKGAGSAFEITYRAKLWSRNTQFRIIFRLVTIKVQTNCQFQVSTHGKVSDVEWESHKAPRCVA